MTTPVDPRITNLTETRKVAEALANKGSTGRDKLFKACQGLESVFLTMIWKEMQKSAKVDLGGWGAFAEQAMGENWAKSGGIGLAKVLYKNMSKTLPN